MPRYGVFIHQVHIADGFADDCDELIQQCLKLETLNYQAFCNIWKELNIGCLYKGRILGAEVAELSEEVIHIAKHYMLKNTSNFEETVAGLFIVYALLNLQPYPGFAHLRIVPEDIPALDRIEFVARREKRHDVLYILASVLIKGPVQYQAANREYGMDVATRKYLEEFTSIDQLGLRPKGVIYRQNEELDIIKELDFITKRYTKAKVAVCDTAEFDRNLNYIDNDLANDLQNSLKKLISGIHEEQYGFVDAGGDGSIMKKRKQIRDKAMKKGINPLNYLKSSKDEDTPSIKVESPKKRTPKSPKSNQSNKQRKGKKRPRNDDETEEETKTKKRSNRRIFKRKLPICPRAVKSIYRYRSLNDEDASAENQGSKTTADIISSDSDIDLEYGATKETKKKKEKVKKMIAAGENVDENASEKGQESQDEGDEQELDIQIDTLPVLIRMEDQGKLYEIEFIDTMENSNPEVEQNVPKTYKRKPKQPTALSKIKEMPELSLKKIDDVEIIDGSKSPTPSTSSAGSDYAKLIDLNNGVAQPLSVEDKNIPRRIRDKRCQKRMHILSKFKRQGMLPVANFEVSEPMESQEEVVEETEETPNAGLDPIDPL